MEAKIENGQIVSVSGSVDEIVDLVGKLGKNDEINIHINTPKKDKDIFKRDDPYSEHRNIPPYTNIRTKDTPFTVRLDQTTAKSNGQMRNKTKLDPFSQSILNAISGKLSSDNIRIFLIKK